MNGAKVFTLELSVRDYECDLQGIVNNAVYLNYFEHTRHQFLKCLGIDFSVLHEEGTDPVVRRIEIDYMRSLRSGESFISSLSITKKGRLQYVFTQELKTVPDNAIAAKAKSGVVFVSQGRPIPPPTALAEAVDRWQCS
jgi:acyl-CoA thioester hydrolase